MKLTRDGMKGEMDRRRIHGSGAFAEKLGEEYRIEKVLNHFFF